MSERLTRGRLMAALLLSLLLHALLLGGLARFDHVRDMMPVEPITAVLLPPPPAPRPPPAQPPAPEAKPVPVAKQERPVRTPPATTLPAPTVPRSGTAIEQASVPPEGEASTTNENDGRMQAAARIERDGDITDRPKDGPVMDNAEQLSPLNALIGEAELEFDVYRNGSLHLGRTHYQWAHDGSRYRIDTVTETTGLAGLLKPLRIEQRSEGMLDARGIQPQRYVQTASQAKPPPEEVIFDRDAGRLSLRSGDRLSSDELAPATQDMVSLWLEIIWRAQEGGEFDFAVANGRRSAPRWFVPDDELSSLETGLGRLLVKHIHVRALPGDNQVDVWLAPNLRWLPVRILFTDRKGETYDQRIRRMSFAGQTLSAQDTRASAPAGERAAPPAFDSDVPIFLR
ncbi:DUF3108 domain-containing protein [Methyloversatilis thermotolerans]|uniref:DUF3108 domain-containing protein n=1 Tax=Methyloversatilis thermotolerans TaxID=1346290 RepID=UPI0003711CA5|nr:DUF3108 domain-containing protein [Methyloversatilis thermotolerans]